MLSNNAEYQVIAHFCTLEELRFHNMSCETSVKTDKIMYCQPDQILRGPRAAKHIPITKRTL